MIQLKEFGVAFIAVFLMLVSLGFGAGFLVAMTLTFNRSYSYRLALYIQINKSKCRILAAV
jgi:hypothetical protein